MVLPGASIGLGCGLLARHRSSVRGLACAIAALGLGLYTEWVYEPFAASDRFGYLAMHFYQLPLLTLIMIGLGAAMAYYLGKDAGFLAPRVRDVAATGADVRQARDLPK